MSSSSSYLLLLLYCLSLFSSFHLAISSVLSNETDRLALLSFKAKISNDPFEVMSSWNDSIHFCGWTGVTCGRRHQRVTVLQLRSVMLTGSISPHVGNLSFLRILDLQNNSLTGGIPRELGRLHRFQLLALTNNSLGGEIPSNLSNCKGLVHIIIENNKLSGKIPWELGSLVNLRTLSFYSNILTGNLPSSLGNLSSLTQFSVARNSIGGTIPDTLGQLKNLVFIALGLNEFEGSIPPSIFNLSAMQTFDVGTNRIHGNLPMDLFDNFQQLAIFSIAFNHFTGAIPTSISNATNLQRVFLSINNLTGKVPNFEKLQQLHVLAFNDNSLGFGQEEDVSFLSSLTNATGLRVLQFNTNNFGGVLPETIGNLSKQLTFFGVDNNQIGGTIPDGIGNLVSLELLGLSMNHLSGSLPEIIGNLKQLKLLYLEANELVGSIPSSIGNLEQLIELYSGTNKLHGGIPTSLGNCKRLSALDISNNNINGTIPSQIFLISSLTVVLNLSQNHLTGRLPTEVGNLVNLGELDISGNKMTGTLPASLGNCKSLQKLSIRDNFFNGTIPSSLSSLTGLQYIDVSRNNLSGEIPKYWGDRDSLNYVNLSFNSFVGMVPEQGIFKNASATSVEGNTALCGGVSQFHLPKCSVNDPNKGKGLSTKLKIIISVVLAFLGAVVVLTSLFFWFIKRRNKTVPNSSENSLLQLSYRDLFKATDGFSPSNLLGIGGFGSVFKATLNSEQVVAVKVFNLQRRGSLKSFIAECEAMKNIRHRNLVKVITACSSIDAQGNDFKALVYEFMANGSLEEWLHPITSESGDAEVTTRKLNLLQRLDIAIGVACGLDYLHHQYSQTPIVHCDLKPSNVLLDEEMTAQLGDFGLVKFLSMERNNVSTDPSSSIGVRGTVGYAAPEYGMGSMVSTQGDVYSYGILLLEIFSGKKPSDDMFNDNLNLHNYVKQALPARVVEITEPMLLEESGEGEETGSMDERKQNVIESLVLIYGIGVACSEETPRERLDIGDALLKLIAIRDNLNDNGSRGHHQVLRTAAPEPLPV